MNQNGPSAAAYQVPQPPPAGAMTVPGFPAPPAPTTNGTQYGPYHQPGAGYGSGPQPPFSGMPTPQPFPFSPPSSSGGGGGGSHHNSPHHQPYPQSNPMVNGHGSQYQAPAPPPPVNHPSTLPGAPPNVNAYGFPPKPSPPSLPSPSHQPFLPPAPGPPHVPQLSQLQRPLPPPQPQSQYGVPPLPQPPTHQQQQQSPQQQQQYDYGNNMYGDQSSQSYSGYHQQQPMNHLSHQMSDMSLNRGGYNPQQMNHQMGNNTGMSVNRNWNNMWGREPVNLMVEKNVRNRPSAVPDPSDDDDDPSCSKEVMRCTLKKIPENASILQKSRLPLGLLVHPFKDDELPVIQDRTIVRCRICRTYINPFVRVMDQKRWQCNLCNRVNELPDDFLIDARTKQPFPMYPPQQDELCYGSVEYIAPVEYMVRAPQPAAYVFVFECSSHAHQLGYIPVMADAILKNLDMMPGDSRTLVGFIGYDSKVHFFNFNENHMEHSVVPDVEDIFVPYPDTLLVPRRERRKVIEDFLKDFLPNFPHNDYQVGPVTDCGSALGPALVAAQRVMGSIGGRITIFQASLPTKGPKTDGSILTQREDPNQRNTSNQNIVALTPLLNPSTDFYKKIALECCEQHIAVDCFILGTSYCDATTVASVSRVSGGSIYYYGHANNNLVNSPKKLLSRLDEDLCRYLTRNIGFEAVLRLRCTNGITLQGFHGNFFVRSTDLLTLPNVNPDAGYAFQLSLEEDLKNFQTVCFQTAVLFTNACGERRIRVHTLTVPVVSNIQDVIYGGDQEAIIMLLAKMAVDRSLKQSITSAREALINATVDLLSTYKMMNPSEACAGLVTSFNTRLLPLYTLSLLKHPAFRTGISTKVDERVYAMEQLKSLPMSFLTTYIYPDLYPVHEDIDYENDVWPSTLQLTFANFQRDGVYLLDTHDTLFLYICKSVHTRWISEVFGVTQWGQIPDDGDAQRAMSNGQPVPECHDGVIPLPALDNRTSIGLRTFIEYLMDARPFKPHFFILREDSSLRQAFLQYMHDDRNESAFSYYEFLQHLQTQMKN